MLKRILAPVFVWVAGPTDPVDPGYGRPGWSPADPDYGFGAGFRPDQGLPSGGHIDNSLPWAPARPGQKPPGRPILPPHVDNGLPPRNHPWWGGGGHWEILDPGPGHPPILGYFPVDPGFGIPETPPPVVGGGPITPPSGGGGGAPPVVGGGPITPPNGGGGNWVPTDPDYGISACPPCGGKPHPPIWAWVPKPPDFSTKPVPMPEPKK